MKKKKQHKKLFSGSFGSFPLKEWANDLVTGLFLGLDIRPYIPPKCGPLSTFLGSFGGAQVAPKQDKKLVFWLSWTISPKRMGLVIWLGACF
jgi:hypothetical protein